MIRIQRTVRAEPDDDHAMVRRLIKVDMADHDDLDLPADVLED